jgi:DNA-binding MarR family transcriptional regulator
MEYAILFVLSEKPLTLLKLQNLFCTDHSLISKKITKMEKKGLIKKELAKDQRFRLISIDKKGVQNLQDAKELSKIYVDNIFFRITEKELNLLDKIISKFNKDLFDPLRKWR